MENEIWSSAADGVNAFVTSYFSSADASNELCAASEYVRETLFIN